MAEERDNYVYIVEADPEAVKRAVRRLQILVLMFIPILLVGVGTAWVIRSLLGEPLSLSSSLPALLILLAIPAVAAYLVVPRSIKKVDVMIGGDFINAPMVASPRYRTIVKYKDMTAVRINVVKDRIAGATIAARGVAVCTGRIKDPGIVVRAILERAPEDIRWRRSRWPHRRVSREEVRDLIEKANVPDINSLLPPARDFMQANGLFSQDQPQGRIPGMRGWLGRLLGGGTYETRTIVSPEIATPITRYVNLMLLQMFKEGPETRVLRRSEPLPAVTVGPETIEAPPLEDVLDRLKFMCALDPRARRTPVEGATHITFKDKKTSTEVPYEVSCQFDDKSDTCCQIRLERLAE